MLKQVIPNIDYPSAFSNWLNLLLSLSGQSRELAACGEDANIEIKKINNQYLPHVLVAGCIKESDIPFLKGRFTNNTSFYVCKNKTCNLPVYTADEAKKDLML